MMKNLFDKLMLKLGYVPNRQERHRMSVQFLLDGKRYEYSFDVKAPGGFVIYKSTEQVEIVESPNSYIDSL